MACGSREVVGVPEPLRRSDRPESRFRPGSRAGRMSSQALRPPHAGAVRSCPASICRTSA